MHHNHQLHAPVTAVDTNTARLAGDYVGQAFASDPVSLWTFGNAGAIATAYRHLAERVYVPAGAASLVENAGAALWLEPGRSKSVPWLGQLVMARDLWRAAGARYIRRSLQVDAAMRARRPVFPHYYLFAIGVLPDARGRGVAGALLRHTLAEADRAAQPAYLENTTPRNTPLYQRYGFEAGAPFTPAPGCPPLVPMLRPPARL